MRRLLIDIHSHAAVPHMQGATYEVVRTQYRIADDGDPEGDLMLIYVEPQPIYTPMAQLPIWQAR